MDLHKNYSNNEYKEADQALHFKKDVSNHEAEAIAKRNKYVVESTLEHNLKIHRQNQAIKREHLAERADAAYDYVRYLDRGGAGNAEKFFGKRELARLRGIEFMDRQRRLAGLKGDEPVIITSSR